MEKMPKNCRICGENLVKVSQKMIVREGIGGTYVQPILSKTCAWCGNLRYGVAFGVKKL